MEVEQDVEELRWGEMQKGYHRARRWLIPGWRSFSDTIYGPRCGAGTRRTPENPAGRRGAIADIQLSDLWIPALAECNVHESKLVDRNIAFSQVSLLLLLLEVLATSDALAKSRSFALRGRGASCGLSPARLSSPICRAPQSQQLQGCHRCTDDVMVNLVETW